MTQPPRAAATPGPQDPEPTRRITLPPGPAPAPGLVDQPTDQLAGPAGAPHAGELPSTDEIPPAAPRPGRRSRTPYVLAALVALIIATGVVAVLVYGG
jgi:hypothetical protein